MLQKYTFHHFQLACTAPWPIDPHGDVIKEMNHKRLGSWNVWALGALSSLQSTRQLRQREDKKRTFWITMSKRNTLRIMWRERPLWQESEMRTQRRAGKKQQEDIEGTECGRLTAREPGQIFEGMLDVIGDRLSDAASSDDEEDAEDHAGRIDITGIGGHGQIPPWMRSEVQHNWIEDTGTGQIAYQRRHSNSSTTSTFAELMNLLDIIPRMSHMA